MFEFSDPLAASQSMIYKKYMKCGELTYVSVCLLIAYYFLLMYFILNLVLLNVVCIWCIILCLRIPGFLSLIFAYFIIYFWNISCIFCKETVLVNIELTVLYLQLEYVLTVMSGLD